MNYLGFDESESYFEIIKGFGLRKVLSEAGALGTGGLLAKENLFKYWVKELLLAFRDLAYKCSYESHSLRLSNLFVADVGIKVFFKNEEYGLQKEEGLRAHLKYEGLLL